MRQINPYANAELASLRADGVNPTDEEIAWLANLGDRITHPNHRTLNPLVAGAPVVAGCEVLWPLTNQASWWLDLTAGWFSGEMDLFGVAYAMAKGRERGAFDSLTTRRAAVDAVSEWSNTLTCTPAELAGGVSAILDNDDPDRPLDDDSACDFMALLADLEVATHQPKEVWMVRTAADATAVIRSAYKFASVGSGIDMEESTGDTAEAIRNVVIAARQISERHKHGES